MSAHDLSAITYSGKADHGTDRIAIVVSKWNTEITHKMYEGAKSVLREAGVYKDNILKLEVPGSYELPAAADMALTTKPGLDGVICIGCVIQGETRHFEFISQAVSQGIINVSLKHHKPVIFGVLTPDNMEQALDRAGGKFGNKGEEAAVAMLEMVDLARKLTL